MPSEPLTAFALNCTLKSSNAREKSSTDKLIADMLAAMAPHGITGEVVRAADHDILPGVTSDEGEGDAWPALRKRLGKGAGAMPPGMPSPGAMPPGGAQPPGLSLPPGLSGLGRKK